MKFKNFSMLELLAVTFVIAMLIALLLPSINRVKMSAHNALCKKNLKDIHSLTMSYAVDHDNTLPGTKTSDHEADASGTSGSYIGFYYGWAGHLIPYVDANMDHTKWKKQIRMKYDGKWHTNGGSIVPESNPNLQIMKDALTGSGTFRMFYCPEVIASVDDQGLYYWAGTKNRDYREPKVYFITNEYSGYGTAFLAGSYVRDGLPTTYLANDDLMNPTKPIKISGFNNFGKKLMITEGGNCTSDHLAHSLITARTNMHYEDFGFNMVHNSQSSWTRSMLTFSHDVEDEYWRSEQGIFTLNRSHANLFNEMCTPNAYIAPNRDYYDAINSVAYGSEGKYWMEFITHENPNVSSKYTDIMKQVLGWKWTSNFTYVSNELLYKPATGKANVLYGDGRVETEHAAWLFVNRAELLWASNEAN